MWESRVAPLSGVVFAALIAATAIIANNYDFMPPADEIAAFYASGPVRIMVSAYIGLLAAFALLWFSGSLYVSLRRLDDDRGRLSVVAAGGGVFAAAMITVGSLATMAGAERVWVVDTIDAGAAAALFDLAGMTVGTGTAFGLAALIGASGLATLRSKDQRRWTGWAGVIIALTLISPYNWLAVGIGVVWVPIAAVGIYRAEKSVAESVPEPV